MISGAIVAGSLAPRKLQRHGLHMRSAEIYEALSCYLAAVAAVASVAPSERPRLRAEAELARLAYQNLLEAYTIEIGMKPTAVALDCDDPPTAELVPANGARRVRDVDRDAG